MIMHFNSQKERLAYVKGEFEEIVPIEAKSEDENAKIEHLDAENEKKSQKKASKSKKSSKKKKEDKKDDTVQAE